ncbi:MAG TPA: alpha/beta fold hydrolase [Paracoccaceae bacterium]|nr:alpha/beta fold hydrolase [Paracoccaceae bacterium]HMO71261.1 alpha/beta fold hydrolase [Paracoccaceae bacterium]
MSHPTKAMLLACALAACGPRGEIRVAPEAAAVGEVQDIFVGTTRVADPETGQFGGARDRTGVTFARYGVSVPPNRRPGDIAYPRPGRPADPARHFLTTSTRVYGSAPDFRAELAAAIRADAPGAREVTVFTHGFNNTFAEGLYRIAQMSHDLDLPGVEVHYSWPSLGQTLAYVHDRDSAIFARDGLERLLEEVAAAGADRIMVVGHSMGAALTMEALRQMAIRGNRRVLSLLSGVVLLSPDIEVDVFYSQAAAMDPLPQPFFVFTSRKDRALALSARLTGRQQERLGNIRNIERIGDLPVTVVDVQAFNVGDGHMNVARSPALINILRRIDEVDAAYGADRTGRPGLFPGVVLTVQNVTEVVLSPVAGLGR